MFEDWFYDILTFMQVSVIEWDSKNRSEFIERLVDPEKETVTNF